MTTNASNKREIVIEGKASDGTLVKAITDARHDYVARSIERRNKEGRLISRITLGPPVSFKGGPWLASTALYQVYQANGQMLVKETYKLAHASFDKPNEKLFRLSFKKDMTIIDNRLGRPVVYEYKKATSRAKSKEALLVLTRKHLEDEANILAQLKKTERIESGGRNLLVFLPLILLGVIGAYLLRRRIGRA